MQKGNLRKEIERMDKLLDVKVGDEVLYVHASYTRIEKIATVTKITPTGRIRIDGSSSQFDKYGNQMGECGWRGRDYIYILTPDKKAEILRKNEIRKCICIFDDMKNEITFEQAKGILSILLEGRQND